MFKCEIAVFSVHVYNSSTIYVLPSTVIKDFGRYAGLEINITIPFLEKQQKIKIMPSVLLFVKR